MHRRIGKGTIELSTDIHNTSQHTIDLAELSDWLTDQKEIFHTPHEPSRICVQSTRFSLVNDPSMATEAHFSMVNRFLPESEVLLTDVIAEGYTIQYSLGINLYKLLTAHFEKEHVYFGDRGFIQRLLPGDASLDDGVYCQVLGQDISIGIVRGSRLVFFNKYAARNSEDLLYYLLLCFQSHEFDPKSDPLFMSGLIEKDSPMFRMVFDYVRNVELDNAVADTSISAEFAAKPHYFVNLIMAV